mmetsp:Transcript_6343/g.10843  ORF Transcript_6343/g.10843 Transcript_6343/m.10843 type:complete len:127 (-) Transcript_6343:10-390(-)
MGCLSRRCPMIRALFLSFALAIATVVPATAQDILERNPQIEAVIGSQFSAFEAEDVTDAWQYASPSIQALFGDPQNFGRMVQQAFPMVWEPNGFEFIDLQSLGSMTVQRVEVIDQSGNLHYLGCKK